MRWRGKSAKRAPDCVGATFLRMAVACAHARPMVSRSPDRATSMRRDARCFFEFVMVFIGNPRRGTIRTGWGHGGEEGVLVGVG